MNELRCADCGGEVRMIRVMRGYLRLGHVHQPPTLHPVRIERASAAEVERVPPLRAPSVALGARRPT